MGWRFDLRHANTVAYLTVPRRGEPPRLTAFQLREFLGSLQGEYRQGPPLISSDPEWIADVVRRAKRASELAERHGVTFDERMFVEPKLAENLLLDLREVLGRYELYGLIVGAERDQAPLTAFAEHAAYSSKHHGLFLIPDLPYGEGTVEFFDPLPTVRVIASRPDLWPGILFWTATGVSTFAPLDSAYGLYQQLFDRFWAGPQVFDRILEEFDRDLPRSTSKRLFHLSDLHFGTRKALENQAYLSAHLATKIEHTDRIVITGDLYDNPTKDDALLFNNFRSSLEVVSGRESIVVPGNHDQKILGNSFLWFGRKLRPVADLEWSSLVVDDELECVFYCFDSTKDAGDFARGRVTKQQMVEVATLFEAKVVAKPRMREYLSVALIHHHPYSFDSAKESRVQKVLKTFGLHEESFLRMEDAEEFLTWCAGRNVPLVLHGHKHIQRHVSDSIKWDHGKSSSWRDVVAVGCGTSLGVEDYALSYNVLEWSPSTRKWTVSFFADPGFGTGFDEQYVRMHVVERSADVA
jgi:predicted MPP superfamily phosphohydrolase